MLCKISGCLYSLQQIYDTFFYFFIIIRHIKRQNKIDRTARSVNETTKTGELNIPIICFTT